MAADPTLVQGAGMAVKRDGRVTFSKGIQAIQQQLAEDMVDITKYYREKRDEFNEKIEKAADYGADMTDDQYELYLNKFEDMGNKYIFAGPKKKAQIMQKVNRDITTLEKNKDLKATIKDFAGKSELEGGFPPDWTVTPTASDISSTLDGSNPLVENPDGSGEAGYFIHSDEVKDELTDIYNELLDTPTDDMSERELAKHNQLLKEAKVKMEDPIHHKKFSTFTDIEKIINNNVVDNTFSTSLLDLSKEQFDYSKKLAYNTNEKYDEFAGRNTIYAWMQNSNKNSLLNHRHGPDVSFREGLTQAIQTMTYTDAGIMVDHDSDPATPDVNIDDAFGKGIVTDVDMSGEIDQADVNIIKADAAGIVDKLIKDDDAALWGRGGYVNTFFNNFVKQQFDNGAAQRADRTGAQRKDDYLTGLSDDEFEKLQQKQSQEEIDWANDENNPYGPNYKGGTTTSTISPSEAKEKHKTLTLEDLSGYTLKQRWDLYTSILADPNIPLEEKQAFMKAHGLKTRKEGGQSGWFAGKKKHIWRGLDEDYSYKEWALEQQAKKNLEEKGKDS